MSTQHTFKFSHSAPAYILGVASLYVVVSGFFSYSQISSNIAFMHQQQAITSVENTLLVEQIEASRSFLLKGSVAKKAYDESVHQTDDSLDKLKTFVSNNEILTKEKVSIFESGIEKSRALLSSQPDLPPSFHSPLEQIHDWLYPNNPFKSSSEDLVLIKFLENYQYLVGSTIYDLLITQKLTSQQAVTLLEKSYDTLLDTLRASPSSTALSLIATLEKPDNHTAIIRLIKNLNFYNSNIATSLNGQIIDSTALFSTSVLKLLETTTLLATEQAIIQLQQSQSHSLIKIILGMIVLIFSLLYSIRNKVNSENYEILSKKLQLLDQKIAMINGAKSRDNTAPSEMMTDIENGVQQLVAQKELLDQTNQRKSVYLSKMSHDIRTTMNGMIGFLELLQVTDLSKQQKEMLNVITKNTQSLLLIVQNILNASTDEAKTHETENTVFSTIEEVEDIVKLMNQKAGDRGVVLSVLMDCDLPKKVSGDIQKFKEVFVNLVSTAIDQSQVGTLLSIEIKNLHAHHANTLFLHVALTHAYSENDTEASYQWIPFLSPQRRNEGHYQLSDYIYLITTRYLEMLNSRLFVEKQILNNEQTIVASYTVKFDIIEQETNFNPDTFRQLRVGFTGIDTHARHIEAFEHYMTYFGVRLVPIPTFDILLSKMIPENLLDGIIFFVDQTNADTIQKLGLLPLPVCVAYSEGRCIEKIRHDAELEIPLLPSVVAETLQLIKSRPQTTPLDSDVTTLDYTLTVDHTLIEKISTESLYFGKKILLIEDNPINQKLAQMILEEAGCLVFVADNGLEGLNAYRKDPSYHLIFMDIQMPVMDGIEATEEIIKYETLQGFPHTPIVALTANALKGDRERFMASGMDEYVSKPINKTKLLAVLDLFLTPKQPDETPSEFTQVCPNPVLVFRSNYVSEKLTKALLDDVGCSYQTISHLHDLQHCLEKGTFSCLIIDASVNPDTSFATLEGYLEKLTIPVLVLSQEPLHSNLPHLTIVCEPLTRELLAGHLKSFVRAVMQQQKELYNASTTH